MSIPKELQILVDILRDFDPNKLTAEVIKTGEQWADEDAAASALEETKKTLLAKLSLENIEGGYKSGALGEKPRPMSGVQAEMKALSDERYELHLELMVHARKESNRAKVRYDMGRMRLELMRSLQATLRNEMRLSGQTT